MNTPKALSLRRHVPALALSVLLALLAALMLTVAGAGAEKSPQAQVVISQVTVKGKTVTVTGKVVAPASASSATRQRTSVALTLSGVGKPESFSAKPDAKWGFKATKATKLTGQLTVGALAKIGGKQSGKQVRKRFKGPRLAAAPQTPLAGPPPPAAGVDPPKSDPKEEPPKGDPSDPPPGEEFDPDELEGEPMLGLFKLDPGKEDVFTGVITGSRFKMMSTIIATGKGAGVHNANSPFENDFYTPLRPGTDGGLSTVEYQPAPTPAFLADPPKNSLANRIVLPQTFFNVGFSIVTEPIALNSDPDTPAAEPVPLPSILNDEGHLSGQVMAWVAAWNGIYFIQGSPKPDGTYAANPWVVPPRWDDGGTTPVKGTYDEATGHFVLEWQSLIVGGPFHHFSGQWHLEGTFEPAAP